MTVKLTEDLTSTIYQDALAIRTRVFIEEQQVPRELEIENETACVHFVLYHDELPVATCRLYKKSATVLKLQRMAVTKEARGKNFGRELMVAAEAYARQTGVQEITLGAQNTAIGFYERLGYRVRGAEFLDANIPHHTMVKELLA